MKIERLTISNFRGIKGEFEIEPNGENIVLVGPNGSGKSSVIAAIDFLLTGTIEDLSGKGTQSLTERRHGPHIDTSPEDAWVEAEFSAGEDSITIKRTLSNRSDGTVETESERLREQYNSINNAAERGLHLLSRDEILDFITAKGGTRSERIRTLLNLQHVRSRRLALDNAAQHFADQANGLEREADSRRTNLYNVLEIEQDDDRTLQQRVTELRRELGGDEIDRWGIDSLLDGIDSPSRRVVASQLLRSGGRQRVEELQSWLDEGIDEFLEADDELRDKWDEIETDDEAVTALERQQLIKLGRDAVDPGAERCPLCLEPWEPDHLKEHLDERLERASQLQETLTQLEEARDRAQQLLTDIRVVAESLEENLSSIVRFDEGAVSEFITTISTWEDQYDDELLSPPPKEDLSKIERRGLLQPAGLEALLDELEEYIEGGPHLDQLEEMWQTLNAANTRYNEMIEYSHQAAESRRVADDMKTVHQQFINARDTVLTRIYSDIEDQFEHYYSSLHGDESDFSIGLNPTETGLNLEVAFHGRGQYPPHALHSEGHQDSMGICLYFALCDWLQEQEELPIMMLDDVVMSIDADHRRPLAKLLASDLADDYQLFVTTHDDLWHRHLRSSGVVTSSNAVQLSGWNIEDGPMTHARPEMEWETVEAELDNGNISIAAHQTRRMAEWFLREACDGLDGKVPFQSDSKWTLGDFKKGVTSRYKELLRKSKAAEDSWDRDVSHIEELDDEATDIIERIDEYGPALNPNVHWNETESAFAHCSAEELRPAVEAYRDLYELLWCDDCGSCIYVATECNSAVSLRCNCSNIDVNLRKST